MKVDWNDTVQLVSKYVVKIRTPGGHGTGFMFAYNDSGNLVAIATAAHVIDEARDWRQPIKIQQEAGAEAVYVEHAERVIWLNRESDSAIVLLKRSLFSFPDEPLKQVPKDKYRSVGSPIAWVGYPAVAPNKLCFFRGYTSAFDQSLDQYLIDGVAINGVSGGPVFDASEDRQNRNVTVLGVVCAYYANRQRDQVLPGLLMAQDLTYMHTIIEGIRNLDQAREKQAVDKEKQRDASDGERDPQGK